MSTAPTPGPHDPAAAPDEPVEKQAEQQREEAVRPKPEAKAKPRLVFDDPLDQQSADDTDRGWGERPASADSAGDLARFLDEKPPHHI
ncbi:hypothetical protein N4G70_24415 [Streptomyces sp. ASQP_92]|uniref:hypothetical protein n=1 Tax=Streptomyces sp. ASQP_92 TaxID=2979116 RepID=UPI0021C1DCE3|nr:hypothetical protein [Streptomyces sp. ASQP_92]MCT9091993.1 hypothetical protein [Streptomyces sp. ASQP_92]